MLTRLRRYWRYRKFKKIPLYRTGGRLLIYKYGKLDFQKSAKCVGKGKLHFNTKWTESDSFPSLLVIGHNATLCIDGYFRIYSGSKVYINGGAQLSLGSGYINSNLNLSCYEKISIGNGVAISENVSIRDSDNHTIKNSPSKKTSPIEIGDNVWIGMNVTILKGVTIGKGAVIAAGSVVTNDVPGNALAAGVPARVVKPFIEWE